VRSFSSFLSFTTRAVVDPQRWEMGSLGEKEQGLDDRKFLLLFIEF
jgi:hypothetical protein